MRELWEWGNEGLGILAAFKQLILEEHWLYHFGYHLWSWWIKAMGEGVFTNNNRKENEEMLY